MESYFLDLASEKTKIETSIYSRNNRKTISFSTDIVHINTGDILVVVF